MSGRDEPWFASAPPCSAPVPCEGQTHTLRWQAGSITLPSHQDGEAELVLSALGGQKVGCVELARAWQRHAADLSMLVIGARGPDDQITATLDGGGEAVAPGLGPRLASSRETPDRETEIMSLLALGPQFGARLTGHVAAAHGGRVTAESRPLLTVAVEARLAAVAVKWVGADPDRVRASLHDGTGWGSVELAGAGQPGDLRARLPVTWLAEVWACGLALVGLSLVVAVTVPGWPRARVLALRAPGAEPVELAVQGSASADGTPRWET
jgi:hypothetical protein